MVLKNVWRHVRQVNNLWTKPQLGWVYVLLKLILDVSWYDWLWRKLTFFTACHPSKGKSVAMNKIFTNLSLKSLNDLQQRWIVEAIWSESQLTKDFFLHDFILFHELALQWKIMKLVKRHLILYELGEQVLTTEKGWIHFIAELH